MLRAWVKIIAVVAFCALAIALYSLIPKTRDLTYDKEISRQIAKIEAQTERLRLAKHDAAFWAWYRKTVALILTALLVYAAIVFLRRQYVVYAKIQHAEIPVDCRTLHLSAPYMLQVASRQNIPVHDTKALPESTEDVLTLKSLIASGRLGPSTPLIFGRSQDGTLKTGTWEDAYSMGIGGQSGFGKTNTIKNLIEQSLITGQVGLFWIIDPHDPHPTSLLQSMGRLRHYPSIITPENAFACHDLLESVNACIDRRLAGQEPSTPIKVLIVDEVMLATRKISGLSNLIERIGTESRKAGVYGVFSSQSWLGSKTGGTTARDNLTSILCHRMKKKQAQTFLQDVDYSKMVTGLRKGQALFLPVNDEPEIITVPLCVGDELENFSRQICSGDDKKETVIKHTDDTQNHTQSLCVPQNNTQLELIETQGNTQHTDTELLEFWQAKRTQGMSVSEIAREINFERSYISRWLNGQAKMTDELRRKLI